ncbi:hypothetical protein [Pseudomonas viridiflava]|uniref:hypothetical protein n=1 Tax=Pseudomonas viridiflava TaxID=33069 RepID=UPI001F1424E3|nr:hypothetical protein [Pseudomonas viridiflava]
MIGRLFGWLRRSSFELEQRPVFEITLNPVGKHLFFDASERWHEGGRKFATVNLAGSTLHLVARQDSYALLYMNYQADGCKSAAKAREAAPAFACAVLDLLKQRVRNFPPQELQCAQMDRP